MKYQSHLVNLPKFWKHLFVTNRNLYCKWCEMPFSFGENAGNWNHLSILQASLTACKLFQTTFTTDHTTEVRPFLLDKKDLKVGRGNGTDSFRMGVSSWSINKYGVIWDPWNKWPKIHGFQWGYPHKWPKMHGIHMGLSGVETYPTLESHFVC